MSALRNSLKRPRLWFLLAGVLLASAAMVDWSRPAGRQTSAWLYQRGIIQPYQELVRPYTGRLARCRYRPTCSEYSFHSVRTHGFPKGIWLTTKRLARCLPWVPMGTPDPVPLATQPPAGGFHGGVVCYSYLGAPLRFRSMDSSTDDKIEGKTDQAIGAVKEKTGELTGNEDLEARGAAQKAAGKVEEKTGDVKKVFET